jgi:hypothetical protein
VNECEPLGRGLGRERALHIEGNTGGVRGEGRGAGEPPGVHAPVGLRPQGRRWPIRMVRTTNNSIHVTLWLIFTVLGRPPKGELYTSK